MLAMTRALAALCVIGVAFATPAPAAMRTTVVIFNPWESGALRDGFTVSARQKGTCWTHSLSTDRPDAWRCMTGNDIHDPCLLESPRSTVVACAEGPFSKSVAIVSLKKPLADTQSTTTKWLQPKGEPWGLRLTSGDTCVFVTGATDAIGDQRLNYACAKTGWIIGAPDRTTAIWSARSVRWPNKHITRVSIATAVF